MSSATSLSGGLFRLHTPFGLAVRAGDAFGAPAEDGEVRYIDLEALLGAQLLDEGIGDGRLRLGHTTTDPADQV
jgi:hypothetical protein